MKETGSKDVVRMPLSPILVVGLARASEADPPWVWRLIDAAEPRLRALTEATAAFMPEFRKADPRKFRLSIVAPERERVILVSEAMTGGELNRMRRWHCAPAEGSVSAIRVGPALLTRPARLQVVRQITPARTMHPIPLLPYWLDDEIPRGGLDIIRVPGPRPRDASAADGLGGAADGTPEAMQARFDRTLSGLMRLLWEAVREVGKPQERREVA
jgi:hypothetical protein